MAAVRVQIPPVAQNGLLASVVRLAKIGRAKTPETVDAVGIQPTASKLFGSFGPSDWSRTSLTLLPNGWTKFFALIYSRFPCFSLDFAYSLTALYPLFPRAPALGVVKYVVRKHFSARPGRRCRRRLRSAFRWVYDTSERTVNQVVSEEQAYQVLTRHSQRIVPGRNLCYLLRSHAIPAAVRSTGWSK